AYRTHRLRLVGDLFLTPKFLADFQGCYEYSGWLPRHELRDCYASSAFFVLPSLAEGFAAVILEALSCGLPVLASRNTGAAGFVEHGREGLLHEAGDDDALCAGIEQMLTQPRRRVEMGRAASEKARDRTCLEHRRSFVEFLKR